MAVDDAHVSWLSHTSTKTTFFPKPPTTFPSCFRGERRKYAAMKVRLNRVSNSHTSGHESDTLTTKPPGRGMLLGIMYKGNPLTHSHTMTPFDAPGKQAF